MLEKWQILRSYVEMNSDKMQILDRALKFILLILAVILLVRQHLSDDAENKKILIDQVKSAKTGEAQFAKRYFELVEHHTDYVGGVIRKDSIETIKFNDTTKTKKK